MLNHLIIVDRFKKSLSVAVLACVIPSASYAFLTRTYHFPPHEAVSVPNPLFWHLDTQCKIVTNDEHDVLSGYMVNKSGSVNGILLKQGEGIDVTVHPGENLHLEADVNAVMSITNHGRSVVTSKCKI